jgi:long-subunit fatty acid transport protein
MGSCVMAAGSGAVAQEEVPERSRSGLRPLRASFSLWGEQTLAADFSDGPGDVSVNRLGASLDAVFSLTEETRLGAGIFAERSDYDFDPTNALATGEPWDEVVGMGLSLRLIHQLDERTGVFVGGGVVSHLERGGEFDKSITYSGTLGFRYGVSDSLSTGIGLSYGTSLEDDGIPFPIPIIEWKINDQWTLSTEGARGAASGGGARLAFNASEQLTLTLRAGYEFRAFRLDDEGPVPDGVGRESRIPVTLGVEWRALPQLTVGGSVGYAFGQTYTLDDADGNRVDREDVDGALVAGVGVSFTF